MNTFSRDMLPILGVTWRRFATEAEAQAFAEWAERVTQHDEHPCEAFWSLDEDAPTETWEVKVSNW